MAKNILVKNLEFVPSGIEQIIDEQDAAPYLQSTWVDEILRNYPGEVTHRVAYLLFMAGYIAGKRADRSRRKGGAAV
nr:hypothetical protein [uncultured Acetatifactor sp.]